MSTNIRAESSAQSPELKAAWGKYIATLGELREKLELSEQYTLAPDHRGMAYRQLFEVQAMGYNFCVGPRPVQPRIHRNTAWNTEFYSIGGNGPDFDYRTVFLDGAHTYRLKGRVCDSRFILAQLNSAIPGMPDSRCVADYDILEDFEIAEDGTFEVILSADKQPGNWIGLLPEVSYQWMLLRPMLETWDAVPAELEIERISQLPPDYSDAEEYSEEAVARRIDFMTTFMHYVITSWAIGISPEVRQRSGGVNILSTLSDQAAGEVGSPAAHYQQSVFEVDDDEALIFEFQEEPTGAYWSFQTYDLWQHSIDFRNRQATLNHRQIIKDSDGAIRVVLCRRDPGIANWLDNAGYSTGEVVLRDYKATKKAECRIHRVKFVELDHHLPANTSRVTPEERVDELEHRRRAYLLRHAE